VSLTSSPSCILCPIRRDRTVSVLLRSTSHGVPASLCSFLHDSIYKTINPLLYVAEPLILCREPNYAQIDRLLSKNYLPDDKDILRSRRRTTGIKETWFNIGRRTYHVVWRVHDINKYDLYSTRAVMSTFHDQVHHFHSVLSRSFDAYKDHALNYSSSKFSSLRTALHLRSHLSAPWDRLSPLCKTCRAMFEGCRLWNLDYKYFLPGLPDFKDLGHHHHTFADFEESYRAGCQLCAILWAANSTVTHEFRELRYMISAGGWLKGNMVYLLVVILPDASYSVFTVAKTDHETRLNYGHVGTSNTSTSTWQLEKLWYDYCTSNHSKCNLPRPGPEWNPHRLIKICQT